MKCSTESCTGEANPFLTIEEEFTDRAVCPSCYKEITGVCPQCILTGDPDEHPCIDCYSSSVDEAYEVRKDER